MPIKDGLRWVKRRLVRLAQRIAEVVALRLRAAWTRRYEPRSEGGRAGEPPRLPHALILRYKYYGPDPALGDGTEAFILDRTLAAAKRASFEGFYWDADYHGFPADDWRLLERARQARPDVILLSSYEADNPKQPRLETLRLLRRWNIPIVAFWWDTCWDGFWRSIQPMLPLVDLHVVGDNPRMTMFEGPGAGSIRRRFIPLWTCLDPAFYTNPGRVRDVDVAFLGQVDGYRSERTPFIEHLRAERLPLYTSLATRDRQMPHAAYVDVLQRSKIGLNFSHSVSGHQLKGRVFETMRAGALLLETENLQTSSYFTPMEDYVPFSTPADLVDKIRYYLAHDVERQAIAARGERKAHELYNHDIYWARIFDALREARTWPL